MQFFIKVNIIKILFISLMAIYAYDATAAEDAVVVINDETHENDIITISVPGENKELLKIANTLGTFLKQVSGNTYKISQASYKDQKILLSLAEDYKGELEFPIELSNSPEAFLLHCDSKKLTIVGNSELAVEHGVYAYLEKLGCRWFFPGERWTIIPHCKDVFPEIAIASSPSFRNRLIWYQYGDGWGERWNAKKIGNDYKQWKQANYQGGAAKANCGHAWGTIVKRHAKAFKMHPEYYVMGKDGKRVIPEKAAVAKFCCSNKDLIKLVAEDSLAQLEKAKEINPYEYMVSVEPSDGGFMCYCDQCSKLGSGKPSDMVVNLANGVAKYLRQHDPNAWVGFYAYSAHQDPPSLPMESNIYVQMAMGFNTTKYSLDELLKIWGEKAGAIGIREYYSVMAWNYNLPGRARGGDIDYHKKTIPFWYRLGATSISAESSNNWAAQGLGYYIASRLMWDVNANVDQLQDDFYTKAFGKAQKPIRELYAMWHDSPPLIPCYLARWLIKLDEVSKLTNDSAVLARINDLKAYLHYVMLYSDFEKATRGNDAREKYLAMLEYAYRIKSRNMIHSWALARRIANGRFPSSVLYDLPEQLKSENQNFIDEWNVFKPKTCPWQQNNREYSDVEIDQFFKNDLKEYSGNENNIKLFSTDLIIPPQALEGADDRNCKANAYRFKNRFYVFFEKTSMEVEFIGKRMSVLQLYDIKTGKELQKEKVQPAAARKIILKVPKAGLYRIIANSWFTLKFPDNAKVVYEMSPMHHGQPVYAGPGYFYVPKGRKKIHMAIGVRLIIKAPNGKVWTFMQGKNKSTVAIDVPEGCDGKRWAVLYPTAGQFFFLDIPPYISLTPEGYIGPAECFEKQDDE